ncbi:uncharacterized protein LOC34624291 [Cyclospora cayetanensis]|uniref:Uncharacterized protein LOC34624291 n=1 Tax=Cyclospora cayetanensis TaxID=88456 RepID=A0A6P6RVK5_9EIME|nr:uncharacterized protein LOC34624291 [Cyclospora cayetanensis]
MYPPPCHFCSLITEAANTLRGSPERRPIKPLEFYFPKQCAGVTFLSFALAFCPCLGAFAVMPAQIVPDSIRRPAYADAADGRPLPPGEGASPVLSNVDSDPEEWAIDPEGEVQTPEALLKMKRVCKVAATALKIAMDASKPGVTTEEIDAAVHRYLVSQGAYPAAINFFGFPKAVCASVNEVACHGIPDLRPLQEGDIVSYDCTAYLGGFFGDCAGTVALVPVAKHHQELIAAAKECLNVAMRAVKPGVPIATVGEIIHCGVLRAFHWAAAAPASPCPSQLPYAPPSTPFMP